MFKAIRDRLNNDQQGFTLIELMVVVLIIAILIAIAIPTFLGARKRAQDRAAQSNLRNGLTSEKVYFTDHQYYTNDAPTLNAIEPTLTFTNGATSATNAKILSVITVTVSGSDTTMCMATTSA